MKGIKKYLLVLVSLILTTSLFLVGCGDSNKVTPEQSAKAYYDLYVLQDSTEIEKLGLSKTEVETVVKAQKTATKNATKKNFTVNGLSITDDQLEAIYNSQMGMMKKLSLNTEVVSSDAETAKVKMTTTYVDFIAADTKAAEDTIEEAQAAGITDLAKLSELYINHLVKNVDEIEVSTETKENTFDFKKQTVQSDGKDKEIWAPTDMTKFGTELGKMITGQ